MLQIVQAYDRSPIADVATDDADALPRTAKLGIQASTLASKLSSLNMDKHQFKPVWHCTALF
jgi:hypothetical protein